MSSMPSSLRPNPDLELATVMGSMEEFQALVENEITRFGYYPWVELTFQFLKAREDRHTKTIFQWFFNRLFKSDCAAYDKYKKVSLFQALQYSDVDSLRYLLDQGVPVDSRNTEGYTLLGYLAEQIQSDSEYVDCLDLLLSRGADVDAENGFWFAWEAGSTALSLVLSGLYWGKRLYPKYSDSPLAKNKSLLVTKLLDAGADIERAKRTLHPEYFCLDIDGLIKEAKEYLSESAVLPKCALVVGTLPKGDAATSLLSADSC